MRTVPGIAGADAIGGYVKQYRIEPDPARLVGYGISFSQIVNAIEANNNSRGANYIERNGEGCVVRTNGLIARLAEIEEIAVATRGGVPVRVRDLAQVAVGRELRTGSASVNGHEVVLGTALMLVGGNSRTVSAAADAKIKDINRTLPPGIRARSVLSRTELVDATVHTVATNLFDFICGRLYCVVRRRGAQWPCDADLYSAVDCERRAEAGGDLSRRPHPPASGAHDRARGITRIRADGDRDGDRRRGSEAAGYGCHRGPGQLHLAHAVRSAGAVCVAR